MRQILLSALAMLLCNSLVGAVSIDSVTATPSGSVPKYTKLELLVALSGLSAQVKPYEAYHAAQAPDGVSLSATFSSGSASYTINGFWDGAAWRIRFAPDAVGTWDYTVAVTHAGSSAATSSASFSCVESGLRGFARIGTTTDDRSVLRFSSGEASYLIGHNNGWQGHIENPTLPDMAARGENLLSFWNAMPWAKPSWNNPNDPQNDYWAARSGLEYLEVDGSDNVTAGGVGNYNQAFCQFMDGLIARAEASNVYLLPSVWSHGQLRLTGSHPWGQGWWVDNPYRKVCAVTEFFKMTDAGADTTQWRQQKNHYRYLCARWGYSRMIAGWVGVVEIDGTTRFGFDPGNATYSGYIDRTEVEAWCAAVRNEFAANDPLHKNSSGQYPLTYSRTDFDPDGGGPLQRSTGQWSGGADARALDAYVYKTNNTEIGPDIAAQTVNMRSFAQPGYHAEFGGEVVSGNKTARYPAHLHNGIWGGTAAGAALMPLQWCDGGQYPMLDDATVGGAMRDHIETLARFMSRVDYVGASGWGSASLSSVSGYRSWGMRVTDRGHAWILKTTGTVAANQTFNVASMPAGTYRIKWYDVWGAATTPMASTTLTLASAGNLALVTPALSRQDIAVQFGVNRAPVAAAQNLTVAEETALAITTTGTDADGDALTFALLTSPANGTLTGTLPNVTYTPGANFNGTDSFTFRVNDGLLNSATATVSINVTAVMDPTYLQSVTAAPNPALPGQAVAFAAFATLGDDPIQNFTWDFGDGSAAVVTTEASTSYAYPNQGIYTAVVTLLTGSGATSTKQIVVTVDPTPNTPPVASDSNAAVNEDASVAITVTATDANGHALAYILVGAPSHGTLSGALPNVTYTPNADYNGPDAFTFKANDGAADSNVATVAITVAPVNDAPVASNNSATVAEDGSVAVSVTASDIDGDALSYILVSGPANGTLSGALPNVTYTPSANYNGADSFTFRATDGSADSNVATVAITVTPVNDPPTLANLAASPDPGTAGQTVTFSVSVSDIEGGAFSYLWNFGDGTAPVATSVNSTTHVFTQGGTFTVGVTVTDAGGQTASLNRSFTVNAPPPPPTPVTITFQDGVSGYAGTRDTFIRNNTNNGTATTLTCHGGTDHGVLMAWNVSAIPAGSVVQSVSITLNVTTASTSSYEIYTLKRNWIESEANWTRYSTGNNWQTAGAQGANDRDSAVLGELNGSGKGSRVTTLNAAGIAAVQAWVNNPSQNFGFTFQDYAAPNKLVFSSSEATTASQRPKLTITYIPAQ